MSRIKIAFLSHHFSTPEIFLNSILKMTPGKSGIWKNIEATTNISEADYYFIMDDYEGDLPDAKNKAIYYGEHPQTPYSPKPKNFDEREALLKLPLQHFLNPGEWWIEYDYDYLSQLKLPVKTKNLICVVTYQTHHQMYHQRIHFVAELIQKFPGLAIDVYGRPVNNFATDSRFRTTYRGALGNSVPDTMKGEHISGKNVLANYNYSLEFDVGPCQNYFSERFYDSLLLWCTPIYFGCTNISRYLPYEGKAFYTFDQDRLSDVNSVVQATEQPKYYKEIAEARELLLNKYQMFGYCHDVVNNLSTYIERQKAHAIA